MPQLQRFCSFTPAQSAYYYYHHCIRSGLSSLRRNAVVGAEYDCSPRFELRGEQWPSQYSLTCIRPDDDVVRVRFPRRHVMFIVPNTVFMAGFLIIYFLLHDDVYYLRVRDRSNTNSAKPAPQQPIKSLNTFTQSGSIRRAHRIIIYIYKEHTVSQSIDSVKIENIGGWYARREFTSFHYSVC